METNGKNLNLNKRRMKSIKEEILMDDLSIFNCHKTLESNCGKKMCYGAARYLEINNRPNVKMRLHNWKSKELKEIEIKSNHPLRHNQILLNHYVNHLKLDVTMIIFDYEVKEKTDQGR